METLAELFLHTIKAKFKGFILSFETLECGTLNIAGKDLKAYRTVTKVYVTCFLKSIHILTTYLYSWDKKTYIYKLIETLKLKDAVLKLKPYVFIIRGRISS